MTHFYMRRTVYKSGGRDAVDRVAYITRQPVESLATRQVEYIGSGREDCLFTTSRNLPAWCQGQPHVYFAAAERYEGAGWVAFEELKIGLPVELSHRENMALIGNIVDAIAGDRLPATYAFHCPTTMDQRQEQPHIHVILSRRQTDAYERTAEQHFKRYNARHPERGGARKDPAFAERLAQRHLRILVSDVVNLHLEQAGCPERVHPGKLEDRGIDREPEPKLFPKESREYREQGKVSTTMQKVLDIRAARLETRADEQAHARDYWEGRKDVLGLTLDMDLPAQLATIRAARALVRDQTPGREAMAHSTVRIEPEEQGLMDLGREADEDTWRDAVLLWAEETGARALQEVGWEAVQEAREAGDEALEAAVQREYLQALAPAWGSLEQDLAALAGQLDALGEDEGSRGRGRVRLWDREREQGRGW